jgi:hypothetical protein
LPKVAVPLAPVVPVVALRVPQEAAGFPLMLNVTVSPPTSPKDPVPELTWAVTVRVDALSAGTLFALKVTATAFGTWVWVMVADPVNPLLASVAAMLHVPTVADAVYAIAVVVPVGAATPLVVVV